MNPTKMNTDQIAEEAAETYYKYEADAWDIYLGHRDKLQAIIKAAIEKATQKHKDLIERLCHELGKVADSRAAHASEIRRAFDDQGRPIGHTAARANEKTK